MRSFAVTTTIHQKIQNQGDGSMTVDHISKFDEQHTLQIFESVSIPIGITDAGGKYVFSNTAYTQLVGDPSSGGGTIVRVTLPRIQPGR